MPRDINPAKGGAACQPGLVRDSPIPHLQPVVLLMACYTINSQITEAVSFSFL